MTSWLKWGTGGCLLLLVALLLIQRTAAMPRPSENLQKAAVVRESPLAAAKARTVTITLKRSVKIRRRLDSDPQPIQSPEIKAQQSPENKRASERQPTSPSSDNLPLPEADSIPHPHNESEANRLPVPSTEAPRAVAPTEPSGSISAPPIRTTEQESTPKVQIPQAGPANLPSKREDPEQPARINPGGESKAAQPAKPTPRQQIDYAGSQEEVGKRLLAADGTKEGKLPVISMDYCRQLGWAGYVRAANSLGGRFFIFDNAINRIVAEADMKAGTMRTVDRVTLGDLTPRSRQISDIKATADLIAQAEQRYRSKALSVILLFPAAVDHQIIGGCAKTLADRGIDIKELSEISGQYQSHFGRVSLQIERVAFTDGSVKSMDFRILL